jgi:hypothetical protein
MFNLLVWTKPAALKFVAVPIWLASLTAQLLLLVFARLLTLLPAIPLSVLLTATSTKSATVVLV